MHVLSFVRYRRSIVVCAVLGRVGGVGRAPSAAASEAGLKGWLGSIVWGGTELLSLLAEEYELSENPGGIA